MAKDERTPEEKAAWKAGEFTAEEAAAVGSTADKLNQQRTEAEQELGNPLAPPPE
jgi:hypothetical protein